MAKLFSDLLTATRPNDLERGSKEARDWFRDQALKVNRASVKDNRIINTQESFRRLQMLTENSIGKMYMFLYDPKHKDTLPYYDSFPLIFPIEFYGDSFLGINLHYLPPVMRARMVANPTESSRVVGTRRDGAPPSVTT